MNGLMGKAVLVILALLIIVADPVRYLVSMLIDLVLVVLFFAVLFKWFDVTPKEERTSEEKNRDKAPPGF